MNGADESHGDDQGMEAERLAALLQALVEADEADIILLAGMSRDDWLMQLDQALAGDCDRVVRLSWSGEAPPVGA